MKRFSCFYLDFVLTSILPAQERGETESRTDQ